MKIDDRQYLSGTHFEFEEASESFRRTGKPRVLIYRRNQPLSLDPDDHRFDQSLEQYRLLQTFFQQFTDPISSMVHKGCNQYRTPDEYSRLLEKHIRFLIDEFLNKAKYNKNKATTDKRIAAGHNSVRFSPENWQGSPFPGLRAFTIRDEPIFFGRVRETDQLVEHVRGNSFTAVVGASGSGKSSIVGAGLIPRLVQTSPPNEWLVRTFTPDQLGNGDPFAALGVSLIVGTSGQNLKRIVSTLKRGGETLLDILSESMDKIRARRALIVVDQFEELVTTVKSAYREAFVDMLLNATAHDVLRFVVTLRGDFYGVCLDTPKVAKLLESGTFPLSAPNVLALHDMIVRPAFRAGLRFEGELDRRIIEDTGGEPGSLALMAYAMDELYNRCGQNGILDHQTYEAIGGARARSGGVPRRCMKRWTRNVGWPCRTYLAN